MGNAEKENYNGLSEFDHRFTRSYQVPAKGQEVFYHQVAPDAIGVRDCDMCAPHHQAGLR